MRKIGSRAVILCAIAETVVELPVVETERDRLGQQIAHLRIVGLHHRQPVEHLCCALVMAVLDIDDPAQQHARGAFRYPEPGARQQRACQAEVSAPCGQHCLQVEQSGVAIIDRRHVPNDDQHVFRPAQIAQRRGVVAKQVEIIGRRLEARFEPWKRGLQSVAVANQLGPQQQRSRILRPEFHRAHARFDRLLLFSAAIAQTTDIDPKRRTLGNQRIGPVQGLSRRREVALAHFEPPQHMKAVPGGLFREAPVGQPAARFGKFALLDFSFPQKRCKLFLRHTV